MKRPTLKELLYCRKCPEQGCDYVESFSANEKVDALIELEIERQQEVHYDRPN